MAAPGFVEMGDKVQSSKTKELKGTEKRDSIIVIEQKYQQIWAESKIFEVNAPSINNYPLESISPAELRVKHPAWTGTMAFPYQNGRLHAGHAFSVSKVEFGTGVRLSSPRALDTVGS